MGRIKVFCNDCKFYQADKFQFWGSVILIIIINIFLIVFGIFISPYWLLGLFFNAIFIPLLWLAQEFKCRKGIKKKGINYYPTHKGNYVVTLYEDDLNENNDCKYYIIKPIEKGE